MRGACRSCDTACPGYVCTACGAFQDATLGGAELDAMIDMLEWQMHHSPWRLDRDYARRRKLELSIVRSHRARRRPRSGAHRLKDQ